MLVDERDTISINSGGRDGDVVLVPMRVVKLNRGNRRVLHPEGTAVNGGLRINTRKTVTRKRKSRA